MTTSDEALARAAASGDRAAFAAFVDRHYDRAFRLAFRLTGRRDAAEDLTQDVFAALPGKLGGWRGEGRVTTWLYRVMVNAAEDARRRAKTRGRAAEGWGDVEQMRRAAMVEEAQALDWLTRAMAQLPAELRTTVALTVDEDMTQKDAAAVLGVSEGTVAWRMSEVKKRLRALKEAEA